MHLYLEGAGVSRLLLQNLLEHHVLITQLLKLVGLVDLSAQVRLIVFCVNLPQLAGTAAFASL